MDKDTVVYPLRVCDLEEVGNQAQDPLCSTGSQAAGVRDGAVEGNQCMQDHSHGEPIPPYDVLRLCKGKIDGGEV